MNFAFIFADKPGEYNTSRFRAEIPGRAIAKTGQHGVSLVPIQLFQERTKEAEEVCNNAHILVVERNYFGDVIKMMAHYKVRAKVLIATFDDGYHVISPDNI